MADRPDPPKTAAEARAEVEARRSEDRARREAAFTERYGATTPGRAVLVASWVSTAVLAAATLAAVVDPDAFDSLFLAVALVWFLAGSALFAVDVVIAATRGRQSNIGMGGLFFLVGSAPRSVQQQLIGSFVIQIVIALVGAGIGFSRIEGREVNALAFGVLAPMAGLALCGLWGARHGLFPDRPDAAEPPVVSRPKPGSRRGGR